MRPKCVVDLVEGACRAARASRGRSCGSRLRASSSPRSGRRSARRGRSCARATWPSSSSAARLTAPSAAISRLRRSISPCRPGELDAASARCCGRAPRGRRRPPSSCSRYCAPPSCAACSSSCSLVMRSRSGCRLCSWRMRCSSARAQALRQVVVGAAAARRARVSRSSLQRQRLLQPGLGRGVGEPLQLVAQRGVAAALAGELLRRGLDRALAARRGAPPASAARTAPPAPGARARAAARAPRPAPARRAITASSSSAWRSCASPSSASSSSKRALAGGARSAQLFELRVDLGAVRRRAARAAGWSARPAASGAAARPAADARAVCASRWPRGAAARRCGGVGVGGLGAHQRAARLVGDQRLRAQLPLEVLDLLRARQQAGLLANRARRS